jgi:hypothetical protein
MALIIHQSCYSRKSSQPAGRLLALAAILLISLPCPAIEKEAMLGRYRDKFVVTRREGLAVGVCARRQKRSRSLVAEKPKVTIKLDGDSIQVDVPRVAVPEGCDEVRAAPVRKGEILRVTHVASHGGYLILELEESASRHRASALAPRSHSSVARGYAWVMIKIPERNDYAAALETADRWFTPADSGQ